MELPDVNRLRPDRLAEAGEHLALAALAFHGDQAALQRLAACAKDPDALRWLWVITSRNPALRDAFASLPPSVVPPEDLAEQVLQLLLSRDANNARHQQLLLKRLDPCHPGTVDAATKIVRGNAPSPDNADLRMMALRVLAMSPDPEIRKEVITQLGSVDLAAQAKIAAALPDPLVETEAHAVRAVIKACTDRQTAREQAASLAVRLPSDLLHELFTQPWPPHPQRRDWLLEPVAAQLPVSKLIALLSNEAAPDDLVESTLRFAVSRNDADVAEIGEWAHAHCTDEMAKPLREHIIELLERRSRARQDPERRLQLLAVLRGFVAAAPTDNCAPAAALAGVLRPGELEGSAAGSDAAAIRRAGVLAARIYLNNKQAEFADELAALSQRAVNADELVAWTEGHMAGAPLERVPDETVALMLSDPDAIKLAVDRGERDRVVDVAIRSGPIAAASVLTAALDGLVDEQIDRLLQLVSWTEVPTETYRSVISALRSRPTQLAQAATSAISSAFGPEQVAIGAGLLQHVLEVLADSTTSVTINGEHLTELLAHRNADVRSAAARWAKTLPPDEHNVRAAIGADTITGSTVAPLRELREHFAARLAADAADPTRDNGDRANALRRAAAADPGTARAAAFTIAESSSATPLRDAAAQVLVETPGDSGDVDRLHQLAQREMHTSIKARFETAARHITSGSVGEAIRNLAELVDLTEPPERLDPAVLVPGQNRDDLFTSCVDQLRSTPDHDFVSFIGHANALCEVLVALAVLASADAGIAKVKPNELEDIRRNAPKPATGTLVSRQDLTQLFDWFSLVSAVRQFRTAHASRVNSTEPVRRTRADGEASRALLQHIVAGWIESMHTAHHHALGRNATA